jgi:hypothetical protein
MSTFRSRVPQHRSWFEFAFALGAALAPVWIGCGSDSAVTPGMLPSPTQMLPAAGAGAVAGSSVSGSGSIAGAMSTGLAGTTAAGAAASGGAGAPAAGAAAGASGAAAGSSAGAAATAGSAAGEPSAGGGAGTAGSVAAGSGGAGGAAGSGMPAMHEDLGKGDGHDVVLLGDSYMSNTLQFEGTGGGIVPSLLSASGQRYRNYAVQGTMLLMDNTYGPAIPTQWDDAKRINADIKTVVMTGGGNDIIQSSSLQASCMMGGADCKALLMKETMRFDQLWTQMADAGVEDIVRVMYATDSGTVADSLLMDPEVGSPPPICSTGKVRCHFLETTDLVMGQRAVDDIHPLQSANERVAKALVDLMTKEGMRR